MTDTGESTLAARLAEALDPGAEQPLSNQIADRIWLDVIGGTIETGERLPTVRQLAVHLGVTPKVVERAYEQLERLGIVSTRPGQGTFVRLNVPDNEVRERRRELEQCSLDAVAHAESLGFSIEELLDALDDIRTARRNHGRGGREQ
ncbi:MAG: GntR family transcriptional regulator [Gemmatimonadota bacterium]|nr:MAG: GntR family transcriptional regulator [Gemmatimonadota bacterium]